MRASADYGKDIAEDPVQAYAWWDLAAANGHKDAAINRDDIATGMTPTQLTAAKRLSRELGDKQIKLSWDCELNYAYDARGFALLLAGIILVLIVVTIIPLTKIFRRAGFSVWWALVGLLGPAGGVLIALVILTLRSWPIQSAE